jgi:choline dehydrogenase-like flavoprotein
MKSVFIDARNVPKNTQLKADVCIIGAGAAGITLAREFCNHTTHVCLLEAGQLNYSEDIQALYEGEYVGSLPYPPLDATRSRNFGGSTSYWGGFCRPLEEIDFEQRAWVPYSGWPFTKAELDPYYERAHKVCQLDSLEYDPAYWVNKMNRDHLRVLPLDTERAVTVISQYSPPTRFGREYRQELAQAANLDVYLQANVVEIEVTETAGEVARARVMTLEGNNFWVSAKVYVLATGGIENARLLLASNKVQSGGLGNQHDLVGRFFMEHPRLGSGTIELANPEIYTDLYDVTYTFDRTSVMAHLAVSEEMQRKNSLLNFKASIASVYPGDGARGSWALGHLYRRIRVGKSPINVAPAGHADLGIIKNIGCVLGDIGNVASTIYYRYARPRRRVKRYELVSIVEPAPNPDSRVTLIDKRDRLGVPQVQLDWRLSAADKRTILRSQQIISNELERSGLGCIKNQLSDDDATWPSTLLWCWHHMGTTRMHKDPKHGVVDAQCRVHGVGNLFIGGSSVFPTAGKDTPTLTIVALAIRLADHIKAKFF